MPNPRQVSFHRISSRRSGNVGTKDGDSTPRTFKILGPVESLLLLQEKGIGNHRDAPDGLAVGPVFMVRHFLLWRNDHIRIWEWVTLIVGEVGRIILTLSSLIDTRDLGRDLCWSLVGAHEEGSTVGSGVAAGSSLELVLESAYADQNI